MTGSAASLVDEGLTAKRAIRVESEFDALKIARLGCHCSLFDCDLHPQGGELLH